MSGLSKTGSSGVARIPKDAHHPLRHFAHAAELRRPSSAFENNDYRWNNYLEFKPKTNSALEDFVEAVRNAEVCWSESVVLQHDGELVAKKDPENAAPFVDTPCDSKTIRIDPIELVPEDVDADPEDEVDDDEEDLPRVTYMVRLPKPIPRPSSVSVAPDTLYVTRDHLGIFPVLRSLNRSILNGNPGIGKSWYQWEYLVYLLKPELYQSLANASAVANGVPVDPGKKQEMTPPVVLMYSAGAKTAEILFLSESPVVCHTVKGQPISSLCRIFNSKKNLMMFEPAGSMDAVPYYDLEISILASVSPDSTRYKEFGKNRAIDCYMPCPTREELLAAGAYVRPRLQGTPLQKLYTHEQLDLRIQELGPFTRYVLPVNEIMVKNGYRKRQKAVDILDQEGLVKLITYSPIEQKSDALAPVSYWFLRYDVDRDDPEELYFCGSMRLRVASSSTFQMVRFRSDEIDMRTKIRQLMALDAAGQARVDKKKALLAAKKN